MCHGKNKQDIKEHQQEILLAKVEALYMLKDRLLARDRNLMFSMPIEVSQFVNNHNTQYLDQWLHIWQPYFRQGVITATRIAIENTSLVSCYVCHKLPLLGHSYHIGSKQITIGLIMTAQSALSKKI
eukprot:9652727-Ditylum_brightwellii.AAC.1